MDRILWAYIYDEVAIQPSAPPFAFIAFTLRQCEVDTCFPIAGPKAKQQGLCSNIFAYPMIAGFQRLLTVSCFIWGRLLVRQIR
jgi:hypothetical protein